MLASIGAGILLAAFALSAWAQPAPDSLARCAGITVEAERLACYDREFASRQAARAALRSASLLGAAWALDPGEERVNLSLYQPNYLLLARHSDSVNNIPFAPLFGAAGVPAQAIDQTEAKFQLSFKARLFVADGRRWGVWAGYTQQSQWQVYNAEASRPFRETNYMPEAMLMHDPQREFAGFSWRLASIGLVHQSNGRAEPLSRSWNRVIAQLGVERGDFALILRPWYRIKEDAAEDDNSDITDYFGHGDLTALYKWRQHSFNFMARGNLSTGKGALQLAWTSPRFLGPLRGYAQLFSGYGESLIDYNWRQTTFGIGIALNDLL